MQSITDGVSLARALSSTIDGSVKRLLIRRRDQLGGEITDDVLILIIEAGDTPDEVERQLGFSPLENPGDGSRWGQPDFSPGFEFCEDLGFCWEMTFEFGALTCVVIVQNKPGVHVRYLDFCRCFAAPASVPI